MKKRLTRLLSGSVRKLIPVFTFILFFLLPNHSRAQAGTSCADAIDLGSHSGFLENQLSAGNDQWYFFKADSADVIISANNRSLSDSAFRYIRLYSGTCSNLTLIDSGNISPLLRPYAAANGLSLGNIYFVELVSPNSTDVRFDLSLQFYDHSQILSPCPCPSPYNNPGNTCDLICNGGFETIQSTNVNAGQLDLACPWFQILSSGTSSDLYHASSVNSLFGIPNNFYGNQFPHTGYGYAGFAPYVLPAWNQSWAYPDYKEYLMIPLKAPLVAGQCYTLTFYLVRGESGIFASGNFGVYFSAGIPSQAFGDRIHVTPQVVFPSIITDKTNWTQLTITYTPSVSGEQYMTIGNFDPATSTPNAQYGNYNSDPSVIWHEPVFSYYYIDDVSLVPCCNAMTLSGGPGCYPDPFTLSATSNCQPATFSWAPASQIIGPNGATVTANGQPPGNDFYCTMTLTGYGCTNTDTLPVTIAQSPVANAGNDITLCVGSLAPVTLTGSGSLPLTNFAALFGWSQVGGPQLCTQCSSVVVTPTVTTSYVFSLQGTHGPPCIDYDTVTVFVEPPPVIHLSAPANATLCDGQLNFTVTGVPTGASVSWSSNAQQSTFLGQNYSATWTSNTYTQDGYVTVTVTTAGGCTSKDSVEIPHCCCSATFPTPSLQAINDNVDSLITHYPGQVIVSGSDTRIVTQDLCISGLFTVNRDLDLRNVHVHMGANAKINILPGVTLTLEAIGTSITQQTTVNACYKMWDGIYINGTTARLIVKDGTVIEDGKQAIVSVNGGVFQVEGGTASGPVKLNKNYVAIWVKKYNGTHPGYIRNTIISCDAPGQPGSTSGLTSAGPACLPPYSNTNSWAGIIVDTCSSFSVGDTAQAYYRNLFERTRYGVYSRKSTVTVWNNEFRFISSPSLILQNATPQGIGVYATNNGTVPSNTLTAGVPGTKKANNVFKWCQYGVYAEKNMHLYCQYNQFDSCTVKGIAAVACYNRTILIDRDTLHDCTGINIYCLGTNNSTVTITNNKINQGTTVTASNFGQTGIYVANAVLATTHLYIHDNAIQKMRNGIWVSRVNNAKIYDNDAITFIPGQPISQILPVTGIRVEMSNNVLVRANKVKYTGVPASNMYDRMFGIRLLNCKNDTVTQDSLINLGSGIYLKGACNPSVLACNKMKDCVFGINFGYTNSVTTAVPLNDQLRFGAAQTPTPTGNVWNGCTNDMKGGIQSTSFGGINWWANASNAPTSLSLVANSLTNANTATILATQDSCSGFLAPLSVNEISLRTYLLGNICVTPFSYDTLADDYQYNDIMFAYRMLRDHPSWLNLEDPDDAYYQDFYNNLDKTNFQYLADAEDDLASGNYAKAAGDLSAVNPVTVQDDNRKEVLTVYLNSWAIDSLAFTEEQVITLNGIAGQELLNGGVAVMDARNMLGIESSDSANLRLMHTEEPASSNTVNPVYPNPATGQIFVEADIPEGQTGEFEVIDLTGRLIKSWTMTGGQKTCSFDASALPAGIYVYRVKIAGEAVLTDRLVIIKED